MVNGWAQPTTSAPTPPDRAENRVMSLFCDKYETATAVNSYCESWGQTTALTQGDVDGDNYLYYTNFNYAGWQFAPINAVAMTHLHIDVWMAQAGSVRIVPIYGGEGLSTDDTHGYVLTLAEAGWTSFDLDLATDLAGLNLSSIFQVKFDTPAEGITSFAVDNVYFYNNSTAVDEEAPSKPEVSVVSTSYFNAVLSCNATDNSGSVTYNVTADGGITATGGGASGVAANVTVSGLQAGTEYTFTVTASDLDGNTSEATTVTATTLTAPAPAEAPKHDAANVFSIYSDAYTAGTWFNIGGWGQTTVATEVPLAENDKVYLLENYNYLGWEMNGNQSIGDLTGLEYLHVDVYAVADGASFTITPIWGTGSRQDYTCTPLTVGQWNSYDVPLTVFESLDLTSIYQIAFGGGGTLFLDNVYFWKEGNTLLMQPEALKADITTADGQLRVQVAETAHIRVYNLMGACVAEAQAADWQTALPAGTYVVTVNGQACKVVL